MCDLGLEISLFGPWHPHLCSPKGVTFLHWEVRGGIRDEAASEQRHKGSKRMSHVGLWRRDSNS